MILSFPARRVLSLSLSTVVVSLCGLNSGSSWASDETISMTAAPAPPRILSPGVLGAVPNTDFLYMIAATGQHPLTFAATGLPTGLSIDSATGIIKGTIGAAAKNVVSVTAMNAMGSAKLDITIDSTGPISPTPPMGWNSYDSFGATVTESQVMAQARAQLSVLQPYGFRYVTVDYLWFDPNDPIDANGRFQPDTGRFPSATGSLGLKPLVDQIHAMGLNFGLHVMRGIPRKSVSQKTPIANSTYNASNAANTGDPCTWDMHMWGVNGGSAAGQAWYDSVFAQYASWGVDFVKVDDLLKNDVMPYVYRQGEVDAIRRALDKTGRAIVLSLSPGPMAPSDVKDLSQATMWRMVNDLWDENGLSSLSTVFSTAGSWQGVQNISLGHWPDADMLPLGYMEPKCPIAGNHRTVLSHNQQVSMLSLWAMLPSPLIFGGNVVDLTSDSSTGPWTTALLTNEEILAVDQDALGQRGRRVVSSGSEEVWTKGLTGGRVAVAIFNHGSTDQSFTVSSSQIGIAGPMVIRNAWQRSYASMSASDLTATVPTDGALLFVVSPANGSGAPDASAGTDSGSVSVPEEDGGGDVSTGASGSLGASGTTTGTTTGSPSGDDASIPPDGDATLASPPADGTEAASGSSPEDDGGSSESSTGGSTSMGTATSTATDAATRDTSSGGCSVPSRHRAAGSARGLLLAVAMACGARWRRVRSRKAARKHVAAA